MLYYVTGEPSAQVEESTLKRPKLPKKTQKFDQKELIKAVNKLQIKKDKYATRLTKALNLSENKTFQNTIKNLLPWLLCSQ